MTTGKLTNIAQHDWLSLSLVANQAYVITVTGLDAYAVLFAGSASTLSDADSELGGQETILTAGTATTSTLFFEPTTTGTYYIDVSDLTNLASYSVTAAAVSTDYTDNVSTAGTIAIGGAATAGKLTSPGQVDWLAVSLTANQGYLFTVTGLDQYAELLMGASSDLDTSLAGSTSVATGGTLTIGHVFYEPTTSGIYYLSISDGADIASYSVTGKTVTTDYTDNTTTTGTVATTGVATHGTLASPGQHDWLAVTLTANQGYLFTITGLDSDAQIEAGPGSSLSDALAGGEAFITPGTATTNLLFYEPSTTGTYYLDISDSNTTASYSVSARPVSTDYTDNSSTTGGVIIGGAATTVDLTTPGQHDWLKFALTADQAYLFTVSGVSFSTVEVGPVPEVSDAVLSTQQSVGLSFTSVNDTFFEPLTSGTYYLDISGLFGATGTFSVSGATVSPDYADNPTTKGSVVIGGAATKGTLASPGQHDWLAVTLTANQAYEFTTSGLSSADVLVGSAASLEHTFAGGESPSGTGFPVTVDTFYEPSVSGTYYLDISDDGYTESYSVTGVAVSTDYTDNTSTSGVVAACFVSGTGIATADGDVPVEALRCGDVVRLHRGGAAPIAWIGTREVSAAAPIRIRAHAFAQGRPRRDLILSPDHAVFTKGVLIPARYLVNGTTILEEPPRPVTYWHIELAHHDILLAEGLPCESYLETGNRASFANGGGIVRLDPDFAPPAGSEQIWDAAGCAKLRVAGPEVRRAIAGLDRRAVELGYPPRGKIRRERTRRHTGTFDLLALLRPGWYRAAYPDVRASGIDARTHYGTWGRSEGRLPCAEVELLDGLSLIDPTSVAVGMSDVVLAGIDPAVHFCQHGWRERRRPNPYFDIGWYVSRYDIPAGQNPLLHYVLRGEPDGLPPSEHFDPGWYRKRYALAPTQSPLAHYLRHRGSGQFSPVPGFDVAFHIQTDATGWQAGHDPYAHFLAFRRNSGVPQRLAA